MAKYETIKAKKNREDSRRNRSYDNGHEILAIFIKGFKG